MIRANCGAVVSFVVVTVQDFDDVVGNPGRQRSTRCGVVAIVDAAQEVVVSLSCLTSFDVFLPVLCAGFSDRALLPLLPLLLLVYLQLILVAVLQLREMGGCVLHPRARGRGRHHGCASRSHRVGI
jgi:hypothetical protein